MSQIVHIANTNMEFELACPSFQPLEISLSRHIQCLQLQFLPLLYAQPTDIVAVTALPSLDYLAFLQEKGWWPQGLPQLALIKDYEAFKRKLCLSWGPSRQVQVWAESRQMSYFLPDWKVVQLVNSKAFSFRYSTLPKAELLFTEQALLTWLRKVNGPKVLKTCFGLSGKGNYYVDASSPLSAILTFCQKEWRQNRPIIGEPWLKRLYDFSTQWLIHSNHYIEWIGATRFETNEQGVYQGTLAGPKELLFASFEPFLEEHCQSALKALKDIAKMGFFGFIGIDAMLYRNQQDQSICLYPLVEINGRQTMSLVALLLQQRVCPQQILSITFQTNCSLQHSLLPKQIINDKGKTIDFRKEMFAAIL